MPALDFPLDTLRTYRGSATVPEDLGDFWDATLADARALPLEVVLEPVDTGLELVDTFDVTFTGFSGARIKAWLHLPASARGDVRARPLPAVVQYVGYSGGRGLPHQDTVWAQAGWAMLIMDTRARAMGDSQATRRTRIRAPAGTRTPG